MYVTNMKDYGHLVDFEDYDTSHLHNDLWQISKNEYVSFFYYLTSVNIDK